MTPKAIYIVNHSGLDALRNLLAMQRSLDSKFSLSYVAKRLGIKSRSYLSEVLKGKKKLNERHIEPVVTILDLDAGERELLASKLLLEMGDLNPTAVSKLQKKIEDAEKKFFQAEVRVGEVKDLDLLIQLAMSLFLFPDKTATRRQLIDLFGKDRYEEVDRALSELLRHNLLIRKVESYQIASDFANMFHLKTASTRMGELNYLRSSLSEAIDNIQGFASNPESHIFFSGVVTTELEKYLISQSAIKQQLLDMQATIESEEADTLVRFNVQIYPLVSRKSQPGSI